MEAKHDLKTLKLIVENNLLKKDSIFVLDSGRLIFCHPEMEHIGPNVPNIKNPARVGHSSGDIHIHYKRFKQFDKKFQLWLLAYGYFRFKVNSDSDADIKASSVYVKNYGIKGLFPQFIELVKRGPSEHNRLRLKTLQKMVKK
jgi:hypothetical protein